MTDGLHYCPECRNAVFAKHLRDLPNDCPACGKADSTERGVTMWERPI